MKILYAASECSPFIKTGGLADVAGTLPVAMARQGADVRVILPKYRDISQYWKDRMQHVASFYLNMGWRRQYCGIESLEYQGVIFYFVDNEFYFARDSVYGSGDEEGERFAYFCRAVLEAIPYLDFVPDVLHCNDWQTGMIPALLRIQYSRLPLYTNIHTAFTIHNLRYQGVFPWNFIDDMLGLGEQYYNPEYLEYYGCMSFMKGALVFSDAVNTVSRTYAEEIQTPYFGERLDGMLRKRSGALTGIVNGIDPAQYDPRTNQYLPAHYSAEDFSGKRECKMALQQEMGLAVNPDVPLVGIVTRLTEQKGLDLIERVLDDIMRQDVQFCILGTGEERYCELFTWAAWRYSGRLAARIEVSESLAQRIYAGSDIFLMPSQFEPCGLAQMIALHYGTIPLVRETGGLKDTVIPYNKYTDEGNGFSFANYNAHEMLFTLEHAIEYYHDRPLWERMMKRAMAADFTWDRSAQEYLDMYARILGPERAAAHAEEASVPAAEETPAPAEQTPAETEKKEPAEGKKPARRRAPAKKTEAGAAAEKKPAVKKTAAGKSAKKSAAEEKPE